MAESRQRTQVAGHNKVVHALNAGLPVAISTAWPRLTNMRAALLNAQEPIPGYGHPVSLVGYTCESGRIEDATFIFKNS